MAKILLYEDNLLWSARLAVAARSAGHQVSVKTRPDLEPGEVAIIDLGSVLLTPLDLIPKLAEQGTVVLGHIGHRETTLIEAALKAGCKYVASNGEISKKFPEMLAHLLAE
jgi:hypothetical protein